MINLVSQRAKRLYVAEFDRQMTTLENIFVREIRPVLNRAYFNSASFVRQGELNIDQVVNELTPRMINRLFKHYKRVSTIFSNKAFKIIENSKAINIPEIKTPKDEFWREMNTWMTTEAGEKITKINRSTRNNINAVIQRGLNDGISHIDIAKNIRKNGLITNRSRAVMISRTETHTVAVKAVDASVKSTRIEMEREWVSAKDLRTRTMGKGSQFEHFLSFPAGPDGERVKQDGFFHKTGESLKYPGDPRGSAANVILCRCVLVYHTVRRMEDLKPYVPEEMPYEYTPFKGSKVNQDFQNKLEGAFGEKSKVKFPGRWNDKRKIEIGNVLGKEQERLRNKYPGLNKYFLGKEMKNLKFKNKTGLELDLFNRKSLEGGYLGEAWLSKMEVATKNMALNEKSIVTGSYSIHQKIIRGQAEFHDMNLPVLYRHELGHIIHYHIGGDTKNFKILEDVFEKQKRSALSSRISEYSEVNKFEYFAETFTLYTSPVVSSVQKQKIPVKLRDLFDRILQEK